MTTLKRSRSINIETGIQEDIAWVAEPSEMHVISGTCIGYGIGNNLDGIYAGIGLFNRSGYTITSVVAYMTKTELQQLVCGLQELITDLVEES